MMTVEDIVGYDVECFEVALSLLKAGKPDTIRKMFPEPHMEAIFDHIENLNDVISELLDENENLRQTLDIRGDD
jgi:hypothetical protein